MNCIPHFQTTLINFVALTCTNFAFGCLQFGATHPSRMSWKERKKKEKRLQFVIWFKNDKHLLEHGTWRKRQSLRGNPVSSANSIIIWYLRSADLIWWNSGDVRPISSRWGGRGGVKHAAIPRPPPGQRTASSSLEVWRRAARRWALAGAWDGGGPLTGVINQSWHLDGNELSWRAHLSNNGAGAVVQRAVLSRGLKVFRLTWGRSPHNVTQVRDFKPPLRSLQKSSGGVKFGSGNWNALHGCISASSCWDLTGGLQGIWDHSHPQRHCLITG